MGERIGRYIMLMIEKRYPPKSPGLKKRAYSITILIRLFVACLCTNLLLAGAAGAQTFFTDVTKEVGLQGFIRGHARNLVFADYDNDGFQDVFISENNFNPRRIGLFHNSGDGRLVDQTFLIPSDLHLETGGAGAIFADYDNDGDEDLFLPVWPHNVLLRNDRGRFVRADVGSDLSDSLLTENAVWLDYDLDGYLDLYVTSLGVSENYAPRANRLLGNNGDGTFTDQTAAARLDILVHPESGGSAGGMAAGDFNDDGWPDLYLGVFDHANRLLLNDGQGRFVDSTIGDIGDEGEAFDIAVGDINNDGLLDIFQGAGGSASLAQRFIFRSRMLLNRGEGQFIDITEGAGLGLELLGTNTAATGFADIDNDGDLDLVIGYSQQEESFIDHFLLLNDGTGVFTDATASSGIEVYAGYLAFGDYDEDGFVDLLYSSAPSPTLQRTILYHNNSNANHWLRVELVGVKSNRNGIGARLTATSGDLEQMRQVLGGLGRQQDEKLAHFGLAEHTQVDRLEIRWPSGQVDVLRDIAADQKIRVIEGRPEYHVVQPTLWESGPTDSLVLGSVVQLRAEVRPALFEGNAHIAQVTADLSPFGGSAVSPLTNKGDGIYKLDTTIAVEGANGFRHISVLIDQSTSLGPYCINLSRRIAVFPSRDLKILDEELAPGWQVEGASGVEEMDLMHRETIYAGAFASAFAVKPESRTSGWTVQIRPDVAVDTLGYTALRFALHTGDARGNIADVLTVGINDLPSIDMTRGDFAIDIERSDWQVVELPLAVLHVDRPIQAIRFLGNLEGTFYLDDIRLVAAPPPLSGTAVMEDRQSTLPQSFTLDQNFPNPFNSGTVIRFSLPQADKIELSVYNLAGQKIATLAQGLRPAGSYAINWDGRDKQGRALASGLYFYRLQSAAQIKTRKLLLVR